MSPYLAGGILVSIVVWSGFMYFEGTTNEIVRCKANDEQVTVAAYQHKDEVTTKDTAITQSEVTNYEKDFNAIGTLYSGGMSTPTIIGVSNIPSAPSRACPTSSKRYNLTFKQCDIEETKLKTLYDRDVKLSAVK